MAARLLDLYRLDVLSKEFPRLADGRLVSRHHHGRDAQRRQHRGIDPRFSMWHPVDADLRDHRSGDRVRVDRPLRPRHRVVADEHGSVERFAVRPFELARIPRVAGPGHQVRPLVQLLDEEVAHRAVPIGDEDVLGSRLHQPVDRRVRILRHESPSAAVFRLRRHHHVGVHHATHALDVHRNVDLHPVLLPHASNMYRHIKRWLGACVNEDTRHRRKQRSSQRNEVPSMVLTTARYLIERARWRDLITRIRPCLAERPDCHARRGASRPRRGRAGRDRRAG